MTVDSEAAGGDTHNPFVIDSIAIKKMTISGHDLSEYVIIHNGNSAYTDCAEHLARYLLSATGIDVPLKQDTETPVGTKEIRIGYTNRDSDSVVSARVSLGDDGYLILSDVTALYITGQTARGTCNGVYSFLEDYVGVRFFTQTLRPAISADLVEVPADLNITYVPTLHIGATTGPIRWITGPVQTNSTATPARLSAASATLITPTNTVPSTFIHSQAQLAYGPRRAAAPTASPACRTKPTIRTL